MVRIEGRCVPCSDARHDVTLYRTARDITRARRGNVRECADARCGVRERSKFPHRFYGIIVFPTRAYVVDKIDEYGDPSHVIRYFRPRGETKDIENFDKNGPKAIGPRQITMRAVTPSERLGANHARKPNRRSAAPDRSMATPVIVKRRGVARRFIMANGEAAVV